MNTPISPKVVAAAIVGILLSAVVSNIGAITPGLFAFLGAWGPFVYGVIITAAMAAAGYLKGDPLRTPQDTPASAAASGTTIGTIPATIVVKPQTAPDLAASTAASVAAVPVPEEAPAEAPTDTPAPATATPAVDWTASTPPAEATAEPSTTAPTA